MTDDKLEKILTSGCGEICLEQLSQKNTYNQFASDNYAGACPEAMHWLQTANASGHEPAYGEDRWTQRSTDMLRKLFDIDCDFYLAGPPEFVVTLRDELRAAGVAQAQIFAEVL